MYLPPTPATVWQPTTVSTALRGKKKKKKLEERFKYNEAEEEEKKAEESGNCN